MRGLLRPFQLVAPSTAPDIPVWRAAQRVPETSLMRRHNGQASDSESWHGRPPILYGRLQVPMLRRAAAMVALLLLGVAGTTGCTSTQSNDASAVSPERVTTAPPAPATATGPRSAGHASVAPSPTRTQPTELAPDHVPSPPIAVPTLRPARVRVPDIGVDADLRRLQLTDDGQIGVPSNPDEVGWYRSGGPVVIIGHVDSKTGPAIFYRLHQLSRGSRIDLEMQGGTSKSFEVEEVIETKKSLFPTDRVYRNDAGVGADAGLRLVTCGGTFDRKTRHYTSNVIVFARAIPTFNRLERDEA